MLLMTYTPIMACMHIHTTIKSMVICKKNCKKIVRIPFFVFIAILYYGENTFILHNSPFCNTALLEADL